MSAITDVNSLIAALENFRDQPLKVRLGDAGDAKVFAVDYDTDGVVALIVGDAVWDVVPGEKF